MNPEFKSAIKLADSLHNTDSLIVASKRLVEFLQSQNVVNVEYLKVKIMNHKKRIASDEYYIVHQVGTIDCIDLKKSRVDWNLIDSNQISEVVKLVLDESKIDPKVMLFRATHLPWVIMVKKDLAMKIDKAGFTGLEFKEVKKLNTKI
jgi:hypothetical protein